MAFVANTSERSSTSSGVWMGLLENFSDTAMKVGRDISSLPTLDGEIASLRTLAGGVYSTSAVDRVGERGPSAAPLSICLAPPRRRHPQKRLLWRFQLARAPRSACEGTLGECAALPAAGALPAASC